AGMEATAKNLFSDSVAAYEGLEIDLTHGPSPSRSITEVVQKPSPRPPSHGGEVIGSKIC
ncbi:MAG: hypothetical protein ABIQ77_02630, partial [Anaerolineales bacterium]